MGKISKVLIVAVLLAFVLTGCAALGPEGSKQGSGTGWGTGIGAGLGALAGQLAGGNTESTLIGAGIGAVLGGITGNQVGAYMDRQEVALEAVAREGQLLSIKRDQDVLRATFRGKTMFASNSAVLLPGSLEEVRRVAGILAQYQQTTVLVAGHTDIRGDESYNQRLSEKRANAVANVLVQYGVNPARITTIGHGETMTVSDQHALNRRVEIALTPITKS
ncbi:OmpA family protein [bacterium]|jgi:outer membrane protein OmpA-like peptidoglycan-associated protein|nr:OmpA family protein [bacterium]MBT4250989.1 OmpA family protein [bacterium]MBT4597779.1 OmpA family protein [bacterium]MBT6753874.1 OmpA family protein [bacterium]MBT7037414.1 OmpA family protein [bacterium]